MTLNGKFCQKSDLDWLKMANFGLQVYPSFPQKWGSHWLGMANFTWFTTFPIFCHQSILFLEKSQKFSFQEGGYIGKFFEFFNFFELFYTKVAQNDPQWPIVPPKLLRLAWNGQFWLNFNKNLNISAESWPIFTEPSEQGLLFWASQNESKECYAMIKTDKNLNISVESQLICTKPSEQGSFFWAGQNVSKECYATIKTDGNLNISAESQLICTSNFFWVFQLLWIVSHQRGSKWPTMANFAQIVA